MLVQPWEDVLHCSAITIVQDLQRDNPEFFEQELQTQVDQIVAAAKAKVQTPEADIVNAITQGANIE